jgi:hypothetical protein
MALKEINNAAQYVRQNPKIFFRTGVPSSAECAIQLAGDALIEGGRNVGILRHDGWWIVGADQDWLVHPQMSADELFERLVAFPKAGDNSVRSEILVSVFAQDLAMFLDGVDTSLRGKPAPNEVREIVNNRSEWRRVIAFQWTD